MNAEMQAIIQRESDTDACQTGLSTIQRKRALYWLILGETF